MRVDLAGVSSGALARRHWVTVLQVSSIRRRNAVSEERRTRLHCCERQKSVAAARLVLQVWMMARRLHYATWHCRCMYRDWQEQDGVCAMAQAVSLGSVTTEARVQSLRLCGSFLACWDCGFESRRGHENLFYLWYSKDKGTSQDNQNKKKQVLKTYKERTREGIQKKKSRSVPVGFVADQMLLRQVSLRVRRLFFFSSVSLHHQTLYVLSI